MIRTSRNTGLNNNVFMFDVIMVIGIGSSSSSSSTLTLSKIVKIAVKRKNHENGSCVEFLGSNLYLNGDNFSWSSLFFLQIKVLELLLLLVVGLLLLLLL
jgi:hypothetical protein